MLSTLHYYALMSSNRLAFTSDRHSSHLFHFLFLRPGVLAAFVLALLLLLGSLLLLRESVLLLLLFELRRAEKKHASTGKL